MTASVPVLPREYAAAVCLRKAGDSFESFGGEAKETAFCCCDCSGNFPALRSGIRSIPPV